MTTKDWIKTSQVYSFTVLQPRSPKSRSQQGHGPSEAPLEAPPFQLLVAPDIPWPVGEWLHSTTPNPCFTDGETEVQIGHIPQGAFHAQLLH